MLQTTFPALTLPISRTEALSPRTHCLDLPLDPEPGSTFGALVPLFSRVFGALQLGSLKNSVRLNRKPCIRTGCPAKLVPLGYCFTSGVPFCATRKITPVSQQTHSLSLSLSLPLYVGWLSSNKFIRFTGSHSW